MRIVRSEDELETNFLSASREATTAFEVLPSLVHDGADPYARLVGRVDTEFYSDFFSQLIKLSRSRSRLDRRRFL